jgi:hypothetical protein
MLEFELFLLSRNENAIVDSSAAAESRITGQKIPDGETLSEV